MNDNVRKEFEAAFVEEMVARCGEGFRSSVRFFFVEKEPDGAYSNPVAHAGWWAWQASREAMVIDLPEPYAVVGDYAACGGGRSVWDREYAEKITNRMCEKTPVYDRASLEAAGLRVKQ